LSSVPYQIRRYDDDYHSRRSPDHYHKQHTFPVTVATKADIIEIGKPPHDYVTSFHDLCHFSNDIISTSANTASSNDNHHCRDKNENLIDLAIRNYYLTSFSSSTLSSEYQSVQKKIQRLQSVGSIFATTVSFHKNTNAKNRLKNNINNKKESIDKNNHQQRRQEEESLDKDIIRFYKVIDIQGDDNDNTITSHNSNMCSSISTSSQCNNYYHHHMKAYWITSKTKLSLISNENLHHHRHHWQQQYLPQPSIVKSFIKSVQKYHHESIRCNKNKNKSNNNDDDDDDDAANERKLTTATAITTTHPCLKNNIEFSFAKEIAQEISNVMLMSVSSSSRGWNQSFLGTKNIISSHMIHMIGIAEQGLNSCLNVVADLRKFLNPSNNYTRSFTYQRCVYFS
jgi:hypothetical protein